MSWLLVSQVWLTLQLKTPEEQISSLVFGFWEEKTPGVNADKKKRL